MTTPHVTETPLRLEPTTRDPFIETGEPINWMHGNEPNDDFRRAQKLLPDAEDAFTGIC